jgi:dTDP-4-amino-4,6-dideoxygalactose transaminase
MQIVPRQPVVSWRTFGRDHARTHCLLDVRNRLLTCSARSAMVIALRAAGVDESWKVLLPNYYCPTMISPAVIVGAQLQFYPINNDGEPDLARLRSAIADSKTVVLAAHFFGLPVNMNNVRRVCDETGALFLEDCAHAMFGTGPSGPVGSVGDLVIASLPKFFPVAEGGVLCWQGQRLKTPQAQRSGLASEAKGLWALLDPANHSRLWPFSNLVGVGNKLIKFAKQPASSDTAKATNEPAVQGSEMVRQIALADHLLEPRALRNVERLLLSVLSRDRIVRTRRDNYRLLAGMIAGSARGAVLRPELPAEAVPYVLPFHANEPDRLFRMLRSEGLPVMRWDRYWPHAIEDEDDIGRNWGHHILQIPCHQDLSRSSIQRIAQILSG